LSEFYKAANDEDEENLKEETKDIPIIENILSEENVEDKTEKKINFTPT
jgi:hypothetical protein